MTKPFYFKQFSLALIRSLHVKTDLFQAIQFSISTQFSSIWPIDRTLSGATTPGQSGPGSDGNEGVHHIPQRSSIIRTSPPNCLVSYQGTRFVGGVILPLSRGAVGVFYSHSRLGNASMEILMFILEPGEWGRNKIVSLAPTITHE